MREVAGVGGIVAVAVEEVRAEIDVVALVDQDVADGDEDGVSDDEDGLGLLSPKRRRKRRWRAALPLRTLPDRRLLADSGLPGHIPDQLAR